MIQADPDCWDGPEELSPHRVCAPEGHRLGLVHFDHTVRFPPPASAGFLLDERLHSEPSRGEHPLDSSLAAEH